MMTFWHLASKNLSRQPIRSALTVGGVALTVAVLVSLLGFNVGYRNALHSDIDNMGYQVLVTAKGCPYEAATLLMKGGNIPYYINDAALKDIQDRGGQYMASQTPLLMQAGFVGEGDDRKMQLYYGIDKSFLELKPWLKFQPKEGGGWFSGEEANEVILGAEAAELESRKPGDDFYIEPLDQTLKVAGVLARSGTEDDGTIFFPLKTAQRLFKHPGEITGIGVRLKDLSQMGEFVDAVYNIPNIQVVTLAQVEGTIMKLVNTAQVLVYAIGIVAILVALMGLINTVLMAVFERTAEIGVFRALGASRWDVFRAIWLETLMIAALGGVAGVGLAYASTAAVEAGIKAVLPFAPHGSLVAITPEIIVYSLIGAVVIGLIAGTWPGFRAAQLNPIDAIRRGE